MYSVGVNSYDPSMGPWEVIRLKVRAFALHLRLLIVVSIVLASCGGSAEESICTEDSTVEERIDFGADDQQIMLDVLHTESGFLAVGSDGPVDADDAAVWTSPDGSNWAQIPPSQTVLGDEDQQKMFDITTGGPGFVAVGWDRPDGDRDAAVWTSIEGLIWCRVPHVERVFGGSEWQTMLAITVGGPGLVAVGWDVTDEDQDAAVWTSVDGTVWTRVAHDEELFGGEGRQLMWDVTQGGPGLVAVGLNESGWPYHAVVWTSTDGIDWTRIDIDLTNKEIGGGMLAVTPGGPGLVAVGEEFNSHGKGAAVWVSDDGVNWTRIANHEAVFHEDLGNGYAYTMSDITTGGPGLVAVGWEGFMSEDDAAIWTSPDGLTWTKVPRDENVFGGSGLQIMTAISNGDPGFVAVGQQSTNNEWDAAVWASEDGLNWSRISSG